MASPKFLISRSSLKLDEAVPPKLRHSALSSGPGSAPHQQACPSVLEQRWRNLCATYLPLGLSSSIWRASRNPKPDDLKQGWKLHISATVLTANRVLERIGPYLTQLGVQFKAPKSLLELSKLNSGLHYGYSQTGKCFTVYPHSDREAVEIADHLDSLTTDLPNPTVPFDTRLRSGSAVHYRYGAFTSIEIGETEVDHKLAIETPEGQLVEDNRRTATPPPWAQNPFRITPAEAKPTNPLVTRFQVFCVLCQRGKGGVYLAIDSQSVPESVCVIKEGRREGEAAWDGRDGSWRVRTEMQNLLALKSLGINVPEVLASFELDGNFYLVTEFIEGCSLQTLLAGRKRRLSVSTVLDYGIQVTHLLSRLHAAGWVWRDCKPSNLCVTRDGRLRAIDFEGSSRILDPRPSNWATPAFSAPELSSPGYVAAAAEDLYALGILLYYLFSGRYPDPENSVPLNKVRARLSCEIAEVVTCLLQRDPALRLSAESTAQQLSRELDRIKSMALD